MTYFPAALSLILFLYAAPVFADSQWQGSYVGGHIGYGSGDNTVSTTGQEPVNIANVSGGARPATAQVEPGGFIGGVQMGERWVRDDFMIGFEADLALTNIKDERSFVTTPLGGGGSLQNNFSQGLDYLGTLRGQLGVPVGGVLVYGTGGLAFGGVDNSAQFFGPAGQLQFAGRRNGFEFGYVVGGGVEIPLGRHISLKGDYIFYDLTDTTVNAGVIPGSGGGGTDYNSDFENQGHLIRTGFNYRF